MKIIPIGDVVTLNKELVASGLPYKVHLHDACGRQTLSLEALDTTPDAEQLAHVQQVVKTFFESRRVTIEFDAITGTNFWSK